MALSFRFRRRVYAAAALLAVGIAGWLTWSKHVVRQALPPPAGPEPFVRVGASAGAGDELLREKAEMFDPAPLFVPTARNFAQQGLPPGLSKQPGGVFGDFGAKLSFDETGLALYAAEGAAWGESLVEVLGRNNEDPFSGLGEGGDQTKPLESRGAAIHIKMLGGNEMKSIQVPSGMSPRADFPPLEFLLAVGPAGLIGEPVIMVSSGFEDVDVFFREFLVRTARLGAVLGPGRYEAVVGP